jgi:hypothetical protein
VTGKPLYGHEGRLKLKMDFTLRRFTDVRNHTN